MENIRDTEEYKQEHEKLDKENKSEGIIHMQIVKRLYNTYPEKFKRPPKKERKVKTKFDDSIHNLIQIHGIDKLI